MSLGMLQDVPPETTNQQESKVLHLPERGTETLRRPLRLRLEENPAAVSFLLLCFLPVFRILQ